jgi:EmrB/QacA subfamily drug resistance transporter
VRRLGRAWRAGNAREHPVIVLWLVLTCQLMVMLDGTVVNIALPAIHRSLDFSTATLSWVINGYALTFGGLLLLGARAGDILGRRLTFLLGVALFTGASLLGGVAQNSGELLAARALQGVGGAVCSPSALALLMTMFADGRERTRAIGYYTAVSIGGSAVGMILGGVLVQYTSWRWVLFINVPIGIVLLVFAYGFVHETPTVTGRFDLIGALSSTAGMAALVYGFVEVATTHWTDPRALVAFVLGVVLLIGFIVTERNAEAPITPLRLFADRDRSMSYLARLFLVAGLMGQFFFLTQFLQEVLHYSPVRTGLTFMPLTVVVFVTSQLSAHVLIERFGPRRLMMVGISFSSLGILWLTQLSATTSVGGVIGPLVTFGTGNGLAFVPLTAVSLARVEPEDAGAASGLVNAVQQVGGSLGLAVLVTVFGAAQSHYHPPAGLTKLQQANHAFVAGATAAFKVSFCLVLATLIVVVTLIRGDVQKPPIDEEQLVTDLEVAGSISPTASH